MQGWFQVRQYNGPDISTAAALRSYAAHLLQAAGLLHYTLSALCTSNGVMMLHNMRVLLQFAYQTIQHSQFMLFSLLLHLCLDNSFCSKDVC